VREPLPPMRAERLTFFSDAVVAIALTLLVLPLVELVPEAVADHQSPREVLTHNAVPFGSFLLSFFAISRIWTVHHRLFDRAVSIDTRIVKVNALWLLFVVVLPFPTEMVGAYGDDPLVISLYIGVLLACSITLTALAIALRRVNPTESAPDRTDLDRLIGNAVCLAVAFVLTAAVPGAGYWPLLLLLADGPVLALLHRKR
jgi:uncharacterized membrane protein